MLIFGTCRATTHSHVDYMLRSVAHTLEVKKSSSYGCASDQVVHLFKGIYSMALREVAEVADAVAGVLNSLAVAVEAAVQFVQFEKGPAGIF